MGIYMQHIHDDTDASLAARIACLLSLARLLCDLASSVPGRIRLRGPRIDRLFANFRSGKILSADEADALEEMGNIVLAYFEKECPGHIETMFCGTLADYPLLNPDWSAARNFWDILLRYRMCRQEILDELRAQQILVELRGAGSCRG